MPNFFMDEKNGLSFTEDGIIKWKSMSNIDAKEAIELSIEKWETILSHLVENHVLIRSRIDSSTCALCIKYYESGCAKCPLYKFDRNYRCELIGSPWHRFSVNYWDILGYTPLAKAEFGFDKEHEFNKLVDSAKRMIEALKETLQWWQQKQR
jgi:hypothetical protein